MNALLPLIAISLKRLRLHHFRLKCVELRGEEFTLGASLILLLLRRLAAPLQQFQLLINVRNLGLPNLDSLEGMLVCFGERYEPLADLLQEPIGFSELLI